MQTKGNLVILNCPSLLFLSRYFDGIVHQQSNLSITLMTVFGYFKCQIVNH